MIWLLLWGEPPEHRNENQAHPDTRYLDNQPTSFETSPDNSRGYTARHLPFGRSTQQTPNLIEKAYSDRAGARVLFSRTALVF